MQRTCPGGPPVLEVGGLEQIGAQPRQHAQRLKHEGTRVDLSHGVLRWLVHGTAVEMDTTTFLECRDTKNG